MVEEFIAPHNLKDFEDRLVELVYYLQDRFFGYTYEIVSTKMLKRDKSNATLVNAMCDFEKYCNEKKDRYFLHEKIQIYDFLKLAIEKDAPFNSEYHLGIGRDRSGLSLPQKNAIAFQASAQVLWHLEKNKIPTIEEMKQTLTNNRKPFNTLLQANRFRARTIEKWVSEVFPVPKNLRKGHPSKNGVEENLFHNLIPVPGVFTENGQTINFPKLRYTIVCLTRILIILNWSADQIKKSNFICLYKNSVKFYLQMYIDDWIEEGAIQNGSIFDS